MKIVEEALHNIPWQDCPDERLVAWRYTENPIEDHLSVPHCARIFNSAVIPWKGQFAGVFRVDHKNCFAGLHAGFSSDGIHWDICPEPIEWYDEDGNLCPCRFEYDPRVTVIDGVAYIVWCSTSFGDPSLALGYTNDFRHFVRLPNATTPCNRNGVLFPRKIGGYYTLLTRPSDNGHTAFGNIFMSASTDLKFWGMHRKVMVSGGPLWQSLKIGAGSVPIETDEGWLMLYHGVARTCNGYVYSIGATLLDLEEPSKVLYRTGEPILTPEEPYELYGMVPNVCFPCATLCDAATGRLAIYYGAADTHIGLAFTTVDRLMAYMKDTNCLVCDDGMVVR